MMTTTTEKKESNFVCLELYKYENQIFFFFASTTKYLVAGQYFIRGL